MMGPFQKAWKKHGRILAILVVVAGAFLASGSLASRIKNKHITGDAHGNLVMAFNLAHHGIISSAELPDETLVPSDYREPLPLFFLAAYIRMTPPLFSREGPEDLNEEPYVRTVKM